MQAALEKITLTLEDKGKDTTSGPLLTQLPPPIFVCGHEVPVDHCLTDVDRGVKFRVLYVNGDHDPEVFFYWLHSLERFFRWYHLTK